MGTLGRSGHFRIFRVLQRLVGENGGAALDAGLEYRLMPESDILRFCDEVELDLAPLKVGQACARGDLCVAALHRDRLAGYCWFAFFQTPLLDGVSIDFPPEVVYTYKSYVRPEFRGRRIAAKLYLFADRVFRERGRTAALIFVQSHNWPSIAAARRSGFIGAGWAAYLLGADRMFSWRSPAARRFGVCFVRPDAGRVSPA